MPTSARPTAVGFISLGCPKATVDSQDILTALAHAGYHNSPDYASADVVIVNTCGFIDAAVKESLDAIGEALQENGKVIVTGCLGGKKDSNGNNYVSTIHPKVLGVTGPHQPQAVLELVQRHFPPADGVPAPSAGQAQTSSNDFVTAGLGLSDAGQQNLPPHLQRAQQRLATIPAVGIRLTPRHYAYLKISEGCNHHCTFCIIPNLRGRLVSRPLDDIVKEARLLLDSGVKELLLVSQDSSAYGIDKKWATEFVDGRPLRANFTTLAETLGRLATSYGAWLRLHYVYPYPAVDEVIPLMAEGLVLPYLDMPLQHGDPEVLKRMQRPANSEKVLTRLNRWRQQCPELTIRSTFIAGFPGESEAEYQNLLAFLREAQIDRLGCFAYSPVEGAAANDLPGALPEAVREARRDGVLAQQQAISAQRLQQKIGQTKQVLIDAIVPMKALPKEMQIKGLKSNHPLALCRSSADAPEIDGNVIVPLTADHKLAVGNWLNVKVNASSDYDLFAQAVG